MSTTADLANDEADEADPAPVPFHALSPKAQEHAVDKARDREVQFDGWWDSVYEDTNRMAALLGIEIDQREKKQGGGPAINFSGFCSQGDGACFTGWYRPKSDALACIKAETEDAVLIGLAERLTVMNVRLALFEGFERLQAKITTRGHYSHSGTMQIDIKWEPYDIDVEAAPALDFVEDEVLSCMREFADWTYAQLEAEYDHLTSDESVRSWLMGDDALYDEDGDMI